MQPLSFAQEQLWFLDQLAPGETTYNILMAWRLHGPLRVDLLRRCVDLVVARHESLRVTIRHDEGAPYQVVAPAASVPLVVSDLRTLPAGEREQRVRAEIAALRAEPYALENGPLCRFRLLRLDAEEYVFCEGFHHIITDGWSVAVMNAELSAAYRSLSFGTEPAFADLELGYTGFAQSQRARLQGDALAEELAFWRRRLAGLPVLELPADRPRPAGGGQRGETLITYFPDDLRGIVGQLADDHGASMFMVLAAAYNLLLSRYTGLEDIPTGIPMLGRPEPELEAVVGMFVNMVVLRADLSGDPTFSELIDRIADGILELYEHQEVSFNQVVDAVQPARDPDRNPLFGVSVQLLGESNSGENLGFPGVVAEFMPLASVTSRFDVTINIIDTGSSLRASVEYSSDMFDRWRIEAMLTHLENVLRAAAADPSLRLSQIPLVSGAEAEQLISAGECYVVDRWLNLVPRGVPGELLTSGDFGQPGLAAGALIDDPFRPGRRVRRTGELARWDSELRLEVLGPGAGARPGSVLAGPVAGSVAGSGSGAGCDEPRTPTERSVAGIFAEVLSLPGMGVSESFFKAGGNSLQAMRAVSRINKAFGIKLSVRTMYGNPTVRAVSAAVDEKNG
jgi:acyl carrier protein